MSHVLALSGMHVGVVAAGLLALQLERLDEAEDYLKQNLAVRPHNDQVRLYLGQLSVEKEEFDDIKIA